MKTLTVSQAKSRPAAWADEVRSGNPARRVRQNKWVKRERFVVFDPE